MPRPNSEAEIVPPENYVKVEDVIEAPDYEAGEGIVCGSLTLTGEWPKNLKKIRAVTSDGEDDFDENFEDEELIEDAEDNPEGADSETQSAQEFKPVPRRTKKTPPADKERSTSRPRSTSGLKTISEVKLGPRPEPKPVVEEKPVIAPKKMAKSVRTNGEQAKKKAGSGGGDAGSKKKTEPKKTVVKKGFTKNGGGGGGGGGGAKKDASNVGKVTSV